MGRIIFPGIDSRLSTCWINSPRLSSPRKTSLRVAVLPQLVNSRRAAMSTSYFGKTRLVTPVARKAIHPLSTLHRKLLMLRKPKLCPETNKIVRLRAARGFQEQQVQQQKWFSSKMKALGEAFSTLGEQLSSLPEDNSDLSDSDEEQSHFIITSELAGVVEVPQQQNMSL